MQSLGIASVLIGALLLLFSLCNFATGKKVHEKDIIDGYLKKYKFSAGITVKKKNGRYIFSKEGVGRSNHVVKINMAKQASCKPRKVVKKTSTLVNSFVLWPTCIAYKQCGGCCADQTRKCHPVVQKNKEVSFMALQDNKIVFKDFSYEEHLKCSCDKCIVEEKHCVGHEEYLPDECRCACKVTKTCDPDKQWSPIACDCQCKNIHHVQCDTNFQIFNETTCKCEFKQWEINVN